jgi:hypothetical protein
MADSTLTLGNAPTGCVTYSGTLETEATTPKRDIQIKSLNHGYIVTIGCQSFAIEEIKTLIKHLETYLRDPAKTERDWQNGKYKI